MILHNIMSSHYLLEAISSDLSDFSDENLERLSQKIANELRSRAGELEDEAYKLQGYLEKISRKALKRLPSQKLPREMVLSVRNTRFGTYSYNAYLNEKKKNDCLLDKTLEEVIEFYDIEESDHRSDILFSDDIVSEDRCRFKTDRKFEKFLDADLENYFKGDERK